MKKLLLIVDPQIDFITGTLPVAGAAEAMDALAKYVKEKGNEYTVKIVTADWHPYHHSSFADEGGMWPQPLCTTFCWCSSLAITIGCS